MTPRKIIPLRESADARERMVRAVGPVLAAHGFVRFDADKVACRAGVGKGLVYRAFGSLENLVRAYAEHPDFWPSVEELLGPDPAAVQALSPADQMGFFFRRYMEAMRARPDTSGILARELLERHPLAEPLEDVRVRRSLELFEYIQGDFPDNVDVSAVVAVMAGAFQYLAIRARTTTSFGGVDLDTDQGWQRIGAAMDILLRRALEGDA
ncbi:MAG: TetR family transcriptional regulator [Desulfovibrionaceae bacterium]